MPSLANQHGESFWGEEFGSCPHLPFIFIFPSSSSSHLSLPFPSSSEALKGRSAESGLDLGRTRNLPMEIAQVAAFSGEPATSNPALQAQHYRSRLLSAETPNFWANVARTCASKQCRFEIQWIKLQICVYFCFLFSIGFIVNSLCFLFWTACEVGKASPARAWALMILMISVRQRLSRTDKKVNRRGS